MPGFSKKPSIGIILVVLLCLPFGCSHETEQPPEELVAIYPFAPDSNETQQSQQLQLQAQKIDSFFNEHYQQGSFNGTVLVAKDDQVIYEGAWGYANIKNKDTLQWHSAFQLASVSKPLTATAIMLLYQQDRLNLNDDIRDYIPEVPNDGITIKMLLTHRGGLSNYMYFADSLWDSREDGPISNQDVICLMYDYCPEPYYLPDHRYNYSNTGYSLLASIVEQASNQTFPDFMKEHIFTPLAMKHTVVYDNLHKPAIAGQTIGYEKNGRIATDTYLNGVVGDKGVYSTVEDLYRFDQALRKGKLLNDSILELCYTPMHKDLYKHDNYGLGWRISEREEQSKIIYHTGWWNGFRTYFIRKPEENSVIIVLNNTTRGRFLLVDELLTLL